MTDGRSGAGGSRRRAAVLGSLKIAGTAAGLAYVLVRVDLAEVSRVIARISPIAFAAACGICAANLLAGAVRWRSLLAAYGAPSRPSLPYLARVYLVGFFYNNYLPGGVGGDVVRGIVTRASFGERGATASMTVVLVERVLGLVGLLLVVSGTYLVRPLPGTEGLLPMSVFLMGTAAAAIGVLGTARELAPRLPGRARAIAAALPRIERPLPFAGALAMSLVTQALGALGGWVIMTSITGGRITVGDAFVLVPLAMASAFFPFSIGGSGVREAAFVELGARVLGMSEADALGASLLIWVAQLAVAAAGGLVQLLAPLSPERAAR